MAFATSQVVVAATGGMHRTTGKWTANANDAAGTIKVPGMLVRQAKFLSNLTTGGPAQDPHVSWAASAGTSTVTVNLFPVTVSSGSFEILSV